MNILIPMNDIEDTIIWSSEGKFLVNTDTSANNDPISPHPTVKLNQIWN